MHLGVEANCKLGVRGQIQASAPFNDLLEERICPRGCGTSWDVWAPNHASWLLGRTSVQEVETSTMDKELDLGVFHCVEHESGAQNR